MAENPVCCCGTNRGWLLFVVGLNIFSCILGVMVSTFGIIALSNFDSSKLEPEKQEFLKVSMILLSVILVMCSIFFLINLLPIIAEMKQKPRLHMAYRNWQIIVLVFQVLHVIASLSGFEPQPPVDGTPGAAALAGNGAGGGIFSILVTIFTLVLVHRRMKELQEEIGQTTWLKFY